MNTKKLPATKARLPGREPPRMEGKVKNARIRSVKKKSGKKLRHLKKMV